MQFNGFFDDKFERPFVKVKLVDSEHNLEENVYFLIDTGHNKTSLSLRDLMALKLTLDDLEKEGGGAYGATSSSDLYSLKNPVLTFVSDNNDGELEIKLSKIFVMKNKQKADEKIAFASPSLLGRNVLYEFSLFMNKKDNKIVLSFNENSIKKN